MTFKCMICDKEFRDNYLGGIRDTNKWGRDEIICGSCYNKGYDKPIKKDDEEKKNE